MSKTRNTHDALRTSHTAGSDEISKIALERHDWPTIEKIPDDSFKQLQQTEINKKVTRNVSLKDCTIEQRFHGGFNHIVLLSMAIDKRLKDYVIRVPANGVKSRWLVGDAHNMRCKVALTMCLRLEIGVPVPRVVAFDESLDSTVGALYILMKRMRGRPARNVW